MKWRRFRLGEISRAKGVSGDVVALLQCLSPKRVLESIEELTRFPASGVPMANVLREIVGYYAKDSVYTQVTRHNKGRYDSRHV